MKTGVIPVSKYPHRRTVPPGVGETRVTGPPRQEPARRGTVRGRLESAIARLPVGWRDVFVLSDVERLGGAEVGRLLGLREDEVADRLHRARLTLLPAVRPVT